ncbi:MAG TPA: hypothetical protein VGV60_14275 [Candidatus Polarisedimenticolia bacterium]|jgi:hypothetical protein|nr:hypothetical protein [Candidatus Polarisedimenticolia bacterium]
MTVLCGRRALDSPPAADSLVSDLPGIGTDTCSMCHTAAKRA